MAQENIEGVATGPNGNPLKDAVIALFLTNKNASDGDESTVRYTRTDSNGKYVIKDHRDADGTAQEWHVAGYYQDGTGEFNALSKPSVSASVGPPIPDSGIANWTAQNENDDTSILFDKWGSFNGTAVGSPTYDPDGGDDSKGAYSLDGNDDAFDLPAGIFSQNADFSFGFRIRSSATGGEHLLTLKADVDSEIRFGSGPQIVWEGFDGSDFTGPSTAYSTGSYIAGVATYDDDTPEMTLYVEDASNSVQQAIDSNSGLSAWGYRPSDDTLHAPMDFAGGAVWNKTLTETEAQNWIDTGSI